MKRVLAATALLWAMFGGAQDSRAAECKSVAAHSGFTFRNDNLAASSFVGDSGIVPDSFVDVPDNPTVHGVDVSKYQNKIDFTEAVRCGARFVYVRLSAGSRKDNELEYRALWQNARSVLRTEKGFVGGYHNFSFRETDSKSGFSQKSPGERKELDTQNQQLAKRQAGNFIERLTEVLNLDVASDCEAAKTDLGCPFLPIALDLSSRPQIAGSAEDKESFGRSVYGPAICNWIEAVQGSQAFRGQPIVLFVAPDAYQDYRLGLAPCALERFPVWIRDHNPTGGLPGSELKQQDQAATAELCRVSQSSPMFKAPPIGRCVFHQYTSYGGFAVFDTDAGLDLNRYYGSAGELEQLVQKSKRQ